MSYISTNDNDYVPIKTIVFYVKEDDHKENEIYAEVADIEKGIAQTYTPLSKDALSDISKIVQNTIAKKDKEFSFSKFNDEREILNVSFKNDSLSATWFVKAKRAIYETRQGSGTITYPNLIFHYKNSELIIYATKKSTTNLNTKIYKAPFPNIYDDGSMCFGTMNINKLKSNDLNKLILNMENSFFNSRFSELMSENRTKSNTFSLFKKLINENGVFPNDELVATKLKLKDVYR